MIPSGPWGKAGRILTGCLLGRKSSRGTIGPAMKALLFAVACAVAVWLVVLGILIATGRRTAARELATLLPNIVVLFRGIRKDPEVPRGAKLLILVALVWVASPIDLIPEFIPVIGPLDDVVVVALVLRRVIKVSGADVVRRHWKGGDGSLAVLLRIGGGAPA